MKTAVKNYNFTIIVTTAAARSVGGVGTSCRAVLGGGKAKAKNSALSAGRNGTSREKDDA